MTVTKLIGIFVLLVSVALCQVSATLIVQGIGGTSAALSVSDLSKLAQQTVKVIDHQPQFTLTRAFFLCARTAEQASNSACEPTDDHDTEHDKHRYD